MIAVRVKSYGEDRELGVFILHETPRVGDWIVVQLVGELQVVQAVSMRCRRVVWYASTVGIPTAPVIEVEDL